MTDALTADNRAPASGEPDERIVPPYAATNGAGDGLSRRDFLVVGAGAASAMAVSSIPCAVQATELRPAPTTYPVIDVAPLADIAPDNPIEFQYPDADSPAVLVALQQPARGGVGPDNRIVAFSILCTHKGCPVNFLPERRMLVCPCHWSSFDPAKGGQMVIGQGSEPLPQVRLRIHKGIVQAYGIDGLIYGRHTNIL